MGARSPKASLFFELLHLLHIVFTCEILGFGCLEHYLELKQNVVLKIVVLLYRKPANNCELFTVYLRKKFSSASMTSGRAVFA